MTRIAYRLALGLVSVALSGCGSALPERFYTLSAEGPGDASAAPAGNPLPLQDESVAISAVTIPATLDRPQMVRFVGDGRIELSEQQRWGEPLAHGIARTLAEDVQKRLGARLVAAYPQEASAHARYRITVDFTHLDARSGDVLLDAIWSVRDTQAVAPQAASAAVSATRAESGRTVLTEPFDRGGPDAEVLAQSAALARLSDALAAAVKSLAGAHP